jgi:hypothetical protein
MFRHGAREPTGVSGGMDDFGEPWHNIGELTPAGRRMHFLLGLRNRHVYKDFVDNSKIDGSVFIRSSDYNRTIESVQSQMQGFFPPGTGATLNHKTEMLAHPFIDSPIGNGWNNNEWAKLLQGDTIFHRVETFPVHLFERQNPLYEFFYNPYSCKPYWPMSQENIKSAKIQNWMKNFKANHGEKWMKMTGNNSTAALDNYWYLFKLMDSFISDMYDGRELKKAKKFGFDIKEMNQTAFEFAENDIMIQFNGDKEGFFARWSMSILWKEAIEFMERRIAADNAGQMNHYHGYNHPKFVFFSTHDVTVGSGLTVLNRAFGFKKYYTTFAADLFFELHRTDKGKYNVVVKYQSLTLGTVSFEEFKAKLGEQFLTNDQIQQKCGFEVPEFFLHPKWASHH